MAVSEAGRTASPASSHSCQPGIPSGSTIRNAATSIAVIATSGRTSMTQSAACTGTASRSRSVGR